jgi:hypothetical protein
VPLRWKFQQANDHKHTSNIVKEWFVAEKVNVMKWAVQSLDLNPRKNFWESGTTSIGQFGRKMEEELSVAMRNLWCLEKKSILPLIISATGIVPQSLFKNLKILDLENTLVVEIQKGTGQVT